MIAIQMEAVRFGGKGEWIVGDNERVGVFHGSDAVRIFSMAVWRKVDFQTPYEACS